jgi:N-acetylated-alpha-linked acidic dipeptidase
VYGAEDPISGLVAELEEARALGLLLREGWKPKRTVIYCAWDGEEEGLLGSTEWAETHADELRQHAAMYINSDGNGRGYLGVAGSHSLERFIDDVARDITDPETRMSVLQRSKLRRIADAATADDRKEIRERSLPRIGALGSGSDYTVFIDHLGIASLNLGFGGEDGGGIYHSIYDDFSWFTRFSDTSFVYERALAQTAGTAIVRFADAEILPYDFTGLSSAVGRYLKELQKLSEKMRDDITERNMEIEEGVFAATADPRIPSVPPKPEAVPPFLNFAPMENAAAALKQSVERYQKSYTRFLDSTRAVPGKLNGILIQTERALTSDEGLPKRPWFKHQIYAPGLYTGYGVKTIPGVREAIEQKEWNEANEQIARVALVLDRESKMIDSASTELESSMK